MREFIQAKNFYESLTEAQRKDLTEAIAENIFFLDDELQRRIIKLLCNVSPELSDEIEEKNNSVI